MSEFPPVDAVSAEEAYRLIERVGVRRVVVHPACDELILRDGRELRNWEGSYEYPRYWTLSGFVFDGPVFTVPRKRRPRARRS